jgi:CDP-glycerol glycerophosphotransferase
MEILLICDHVDQNELKFINVYEQDLTIRVFHLSDKTGVAAARNMGLMNATGDYIYFLDSDDYLLDNTLQTLTTVAMESEEDIIYGKLKSTWFGRNVYISKLSEKEDTQEEDEESESEVENEETSDISSENSSDLDNSDEITNSVNDMETETETDELLLEASQNYEEWYNSEEETRKRREAQKRRAYYTLVSKRKGVRNISVLGILFKRVFLEEHGLGFPEDIKYFADVPFLLEALYKTDRVRSCLAAKYIKRKHNDPINLPSLSQINDPDRFSEFINIYFDTVSRISEDTDLRNRFDKKYINYYTKFYAPKLKRSNNEVWRNENFYLMSEVINETNPELIQKLHGYKRRLVKALIHKDVKKSMHIVLLHLGVRKIRHILVSRTELKRFLYMHLFLKQPIKENWVLFESFFGKSFADSPKYIYEYLAEHYPQQYKCVWIIDKKGTHIPYDHTKIRRFGFRYFYYIARCKYYVFNSRQPEWVVKREENVFLQTWHGTPLKKLVFDIEDITSATPKYKLQVYKQSRAWDYLVAPNAFSEETFRRCFMYDNDILETGYPRNDILHAPNRDELADEIRNNLGIPKDKKTILYAPTWRDDEYYGKGQYKFELQLDLEKMKQHLGNEYVVLLRTHYFIADQLDVEKYQGFAYNLSKYDDISELYLISDILITDYSSVFFDYANLKRPILFYTYDLEKYRDVLRGFYIDIEKEVPGPLLYTTEDVIDAIKSIAFLKIDYSQRYEEFYQRFCAWEDGHATEKVVESVFVNSK